jgi:hypothetical protein
MKPFSIISRASGRKFSSIATPSVLLLQSSQDRGATELLASSMKPLKDHFSFQTALLEMPQDVAPAQAKSFFESRSKANFDSIMKCRGAVTGNFFSAAMQFSNATRGTNFDFNNITQENAISCLRGLSFVDCDHIAAMEFGHVFSNEQLVNLALVAHNLGDSKTKCQMLEDSVKLFGVNGCRNIGTGTADEFGRSFNIAQELACSSQAIGFLSIGRYRSLTALLNDNYNPEKPLIHPKNLISIHTFCDPALTEQDKRNRKIKPEGKFPLYNLDVAGFDAEALVCKVFEVVEMHQEKFREAAFGRE